MVEKNVETFFVFEKKAEEGRLECGIGEEKLTVVKAGHQMNAGRAITEDGVSRRSRHKEKEKQVSCRGFMSLSTP